MGLGALLWVAKEWRSRSRVDAISDRRLARRSGSQSQASTLYAGLLALGLALSWACAPTWAFSDHVPDWVKTAAAQTVPELPKATKAVVLLDQTTYTVYSSGRAVEHVRHVVKILRPQGRESGLIAVPLDKDRKVCSKPSCPRHWI